MYLRQQAQRVSAYVLVDAASHGGQLSANVLRAPKHQRFVKRFLS